MGFVLVSWKPNMASRGIYLLIGRGYRELKLNREGCEREAVWELVGNKKQGLLLGDKGYLSARLKSLILETPVRHNMVDNLDKKERVFLNKTRCLVETVIGQLTGKFNMNKAWEKNVDVIKSTK